MLSNHLLSIRKLSGIFLYAALFLAFIVVLPQSRTVRATGCPLKAGPIPSQTPEGTRITFDPSEPGTTAGNKVTITAKVFKNGKEIEDTDPNHWTWKVADPSLEEFLFTSKDAEHGNKFSVAGLSGSSNSGAARPNLIPIIVTFKKDGEEITGVVNVRLTDAPLTRGPIPPGIEPQVDIMWAVMPQKIVHDNFGSKIKKQFYGIEVVIGNDSGYDLELASVGFDLGQGDLNKPGLVNSKIPASGYRVTRGSLQRRQQFSLRNFTINTLKALGPVLTGFTPFFHNVNHTNNYVEAVNVLTNPIEKGFEFVWPDLTVGQLANLEDQSLRDNPVTRTIVKNNTQVRFVVFVPKDLINDSKLEDDRKWRDKPLEVMKKLGRIILIGDQVAHINRVRVVSSAETAAAFSISGRVTDPCTVGMEGVTITLSQPGGFNSTTTTKEDGTYSFDNVPSGLTYSVTASKAETVFSSSSGTNFTLHGNRTNVDFGAEQAPFTISGQITKSADDETSLKDIELELTSESATPEFEPRTTKTVDDEGNYTFDDVPGGATYKVTPKLEGRTFAPEKSPTISGQNCDDRDKEQNFELKAAEAEPDEDSGAQRE